MKCPMQDCDYFSTANGMELRDMRQHFCNAHFNDQEPTMLSLEILQFLAWAHDAGLNLMRHNMFGSYVPPENTVQIANAYCAYKSDQINMRRIG